MKEKIGEYPALDTTRDTLERWAKRVGLVTLFVVGSACDEEARKDLSLTAPVQDNLSQMSHTAMHEPQRNHYAELQVKMKEVQSKFGETRKQMQMIKEKRKEKGHSE